MKSTISLLMIIPFMALLNWQKSPADPEFDRLWSQVESLEKKAQPRAALKIVEDIIDLAKDKDERPNWVKGLQYKANYVNQLEENGAIKAIDFLESCLSDTPIEVKALIEATIAEKLQNYLQNQFYQLNNRSYVSGELPEDKTAWGARHFEQAIQDYYLKAISHKKTLLDIDTETYELIINNGKNTIHLAPTLYEFIANRALQYMSSGNRFAMEGIQKEEINWSDQFTNYAQFSDQSEKELGSKDAIALSIYKRVLDVQYTRSNADAFINTELNRLQFIQQKIVDGNTDERYEELLNELLDKYRSQGESALTCNALANLYLTQAGQEEDKLKAGKLRIKAHTILIDAIDRYKESYGRQQCQLTLENLERPALNVQMEKVIAPNSSTLIRLGHKGIEEVELTIGQMTREIYLRYQRDYKYRKNIKNVLDDTKIVRTKSIPLTDNNNFTEYATEYVVDELPIGIYLVHVENTKNKLKSFHIVHVTRMGYASSNDGKEGTKIIVFDRATGHPLSGVQVSLYSMQYRRANQPFVPIITGTTDENGWFQPTETYERSYMIELTKGKDNFLPFENIYTGRSYGEPNVRQEATILTDRGIYRPGQTIYFKGIVYQRDTENIPSLLADRDVVMELVNPNGKVDESIKLRTNKYGSVSGSFIASEHGLNGQYYLRLSGMANHTVRIEEYKRPKFNVTLKAPEGELKGGQEIIVPGLAKTFAGTSLENANVSYKVVRSKEYRYYWWYGDRFGGNNQGEKLIAVGTIQTDENGEFNIPFESLMEKEDNRYWRPVYVYRVTADVTDENGETRTGTFSIRIGSEPYYISSDIKQNINTEQFDRFTLSSKNAMGLPAEAELQLELIALKAPKRPTVNRMWSNVDYPIKDNRSFDLLFPHLNYNSSTDYSEWEEGDRILTQSLKVTGDKVIEIIEKLNPAVYKLIVKDTDGVEKYTHYFTSYSFEKSTAVTKEQVLAQVEKESYQPGEQVRILLYSPFENTKAFVQIEKNRRIISEKWYDLSKTQLLEIPVNDADRGGFVVRMMHVVHGRMTTQQLHIKIPWTNKKLDITWESFRDKLLPGQKETWRLKISGPDKEAVMAEVLAGMYDASLDEFLPFQWAMDLFPTYYSIGRLSFGGYGLAHGQLMHDFRSSRREYIQREFPQWKYLGRGYYGGRNWMTRTSRRNKSENLMLESAAPPSAEMEESMSADGAMMNDEMDTNIQSLKENAASEADKKDFAPRENLDETVFFMPQLLTDKEGNVVIEFTMNEALTAWKMQLLAHTTDLKSGINVKEVVTQKNLMIFPQIPRFVREGDKTVISGKINKLIEHDLSGQAWIEIRDGLNGKDLTRQFVTRNKQTFEFKNENQLAINWEVEIPEGFLNPIEIVVRAQAGEHTDGEANMIPVLTNQILVTETLPMSVRAGEKANYRFDALKNMSDKGVRPHRLTLEFMENPVWFAVQSMPYLTDYPHQCTEQIAHKVYANVIASHIIDQFPKIEKIFKEWESKDELISNLNKNQELKSALIEETPWLRDAESEEQQMKNIALLFDYSRMTNELNKNLDILFSRQLSSGGFAWFAGGRSNVYITQLIIEIFGHLQALGVDVPRSGEWKSMVTRAMQFSINEMQRRYDLASKQNRNALDATSLHAIYVISFFQELNPDIEGTAWQHYYRLAKEKWTNRSLYEQALIATAYFRFNEINITNDVVASFKDRALRSKELGMYWKYNGGYYWHNQPVETHAHIMEAIALVDQDANDLNEMRIWLLKHKQTNRWKSTISTAKAIYALLLRGDDWLGTTQPVYVKLGDQVISSPNGTTNPNAQAGTGYFKRTWTSDEISQNMANLDVENPNDIVTWGAAYWQYFQAIDQVEKHTDNPLNVKRNVFKKIRSNAGESLVPVAENELNVGDKVTVRLEIKVDRMMEFIHLKDLRAAGFEPVDVLSGYQWSGGLSYYQSTTDLGTHFFIDYIQAGTYVLEYDAFAVNAGEYSGGMSTLQCLYAPEFASHSEGSRVEVMR